MEIVLLATCGNGRFLPQKCENMPLATGQTVAFIKLYFIHSVKPFFFLYTRYSACDILNETGRLCGLRGHSFSLMSTSTSEVHSLLQSDNTPDELCRLIEAAVVTVRLVLWNFQPPGNSWWRRYHLCICSNFCEHHDSLIRFIYRTRLLWWSVLISVSTFACKYGVISIIWCSQ